jgi:hypothetical protein
MSKKHVLLALTLAFLAHNWSAAQAPAGQKQAKDREEYDLFMAVTKEADATKRLALLDQWKQKYADTAFIEERWKIYMQTYQQANQPAKAVEAAKEVLKITANDFSASYTVASLVPFLGSADPKVWADGEKAAHGVLQTLDQQFAADKKPANVSDADWAAAKKASQIIAHQALGWVAMIQKKNDAAETELIKVLELNPTNATVSYWLGQSVLAQRNPDKNTLALFSFARAAAYDGQGALPPAGRQQVDAYLTKVYNNYHGTDPKGLSELKALAKASPLPPADLKIKSSAEIAAEKEEELRKSNPLLATFMAIKDGLTGAEGAKFWEDMKGKAMPKLRGTVVSITPAAKPKILGLAMSQSTEAEILLTPETVIPRNLQTGTTIEFEGAEAVEFTARPFQIKMQDGKITSGLPEAPPPAKKAPAKTTKAAPKAKKSP